MSKKNPNQAQDNQALSQSNHDHINQVLDQFQRDWNNKITRDPKAPHNLENAVKELRASLVGNVQEQGEQNEQSVKDDQVGKSLK